ncbi:hypothetical protein [Streptomyces naganishii]|uniref:Uncharacterized protein n=1 Tax=Streptomyces naganishii JCM 4654 TaxID=1306179 RepID=A0A918Y002_9ACTN|nr:hypothetical protein [Streptomyces naganishii]GHD84908.1 hypothetical protein GCM10010508_06550 [Streptomyces naganishii JCM 4654]
MADTTPRGRRLTIIVLVVWPTLSLAGWGLARVLGGPEDLADSAVRVGALIVAVAVVERARRCWKRRRAR